ncbi:MAG: HIRAN domain-containing protein, partial [Cytophagales bacterium]|nr:HIRAN domain-containing protein [Cytophagales bacterium]
LEKIKIKPSSFLMITKEWINGNDIEQLQIEWLKLSSEISHLHILISEGYYFRYTWVISSFVSILKFSLEMSNEELPDGIRSLSSYIKYGVNNPTACLARSLGVKNRDVALLLAQKALPNVKKEFIRWFSNINEEDANRFELNIFDTKNVLNVSLKLTPNKFDRLPNSFDFQIKGIPFLTSRMIASQRINIGDSLTYKRDQTNEYDPFAIKIYIEDIELGYVPKEFSKLISIEIDINSSVFSVTTIAVIADDGFNRVYATMARRE